MNRSRGIDHKGTEYTKVHGEGALCFSVFVGTVVSIKISLNDIQTASEKLFEMIIVFSRWSEFRSA